MSRAFPVIDADGHILEKDHELRAFLPPEFRAVPGKREYPLFSWDGWARGALSPAQREHPSVALWTRFLDATEIALTVLYPNEGLNIGLQRDGDWAAALARAYNDWLHHDFLSVSSRFQGVALLAPQRHCKVPPAKLAAAGLLPWSTAGWMEMEFAIGLSSAFDLTADLSTAVSVEMSDPCLV